jgi:hypothetical protein
MLTEYLALIFEAATAIFKRLGALGPYLLIELILPGGTLIALLLFVYRQRRVVFRAASAEQGIVGLP